MLIVSNAMEGGPGTVGEKNGIVYCFKSTIKAKKTPETPLRLVER